MAQRPLCETLLEAAEQRTARDFDLASTSQVFLGISFEKITSLLGKDAIHAADADAVLEAALRWIGHDQEARAQHLGAMLDLVNLGSVSKETLAEASKSSVVQGGNVAVVLKLMTAMGSALSGDERPTKRGRTT